MSKRTAFFRCFSLSGGADVRRTLAKASDEEYY